MAVIYSKQFEDSEGWKDSIVVNAFALHVAEFQGNLQHHMVHQAP